MSTLNFTKLFSGIYFAESETHLIEINANYVSGIMDGGWYLNIMEKTHIATAMDGNKVQMGENLYSLHCDSKKQAVEICNWWVLTYL
tara:strand:+ start:2857 stop:3117 length:261 start_codon:yes stop_codon:yes gene_type:complete